MKTSRGGAGDDQRDIPIMTKAAISLNTIHLTAAHWRQLPPALRAQLRRRLGRKATIVNREVLDVARALCERGAYDLAFDLYRGLCGDPKVPYQGCGFGLLMNLRELMGEDPAPIGETLVIQPYSSRG
jgi:hypothetical protein